MARLGELLVAAGRLTYEKVEQTRRAQIMWGGRFGTNLVELGFLDLEGVSEALGQQHDMPAALARHFEKVDVELQQLLSPQVAEQLGCLPLLRAGTRRQVVIATMSPLAKDAIALLADELCVDPSLILPAVAAELRIKYQLERVYQIARPSRFKRSPGKTVPPFPEFLIEEASETDPEILLENLKISPPVPDLTTVPSARKPPAQIVDDEVELAVERAFAPAPDPAPATPDPAPPPAADFGLRLPTLDELESAEPSEIPTPAAEDNAAGRERRTYIRTIADAPAADPERSLGRISIRRVAVALDPDSAPAPGKDTTLAEATRQIRRAKDRDKVADLSMDALRRFAPACDAATLLVVRGQVATSWKGFNRSGAPAPEIAVPLDQVGLVPRAVSDNTTLRAATTDLSPIDQLLVGSLGEPTGELVVVPVDIGGQVMCVIAIVTTAASAVSTAEAIAAATGSAFTRLMRDAAR